MLTGFVYKTSEHIHNVKECLIILCIQNHSSIRVKVKVNFSPCLTKFKTMNTHPVVN